MGLRGDEGRGEGGRCVFYQSGPLDLSSSTAHHAIEADRKSRDLPFVSAGTLRVSGQRQNWEGGRVWKGRDFPLIARETHAFLVQIHMNQNKICQWLETHVTCVIYYLSVLQISKKKINKADVSMSYILKHEVEHTYTCTHTGTHVHTHTTNAHQYNSHMRNHASTDKRTCICKQMHAYIHTHRLTRMYTL